MLKTRLASNIPPKTPALCFPRFLNSHTMKSGLHTLQSLPKSSSLTARTDPDPAVPTIEAAMQASDDLLHRPRILKGGQFTWLTPQRHEQFELLSTSPRAMADLGLDQSEKDTELFKKVMAGEEVLYDVEKGVYPYSQCYAGYQFGTFAGQLGDGRVVNLFEATNPETGVKYELQLKGAGLTPFSRFADGKAVLRSSIREYLISEYLSALGVPTTRALAITSLPKTLARRERIEPCAIVTRMAPTWVRIGSFDLHRWRGDRIGVRKLAEHCIEDVFGGEEKLVAPTDSPEEPDTRYSRFYREVVRRNAVTVAYWQCYGFMNGVLNTDNTNIAGLSMDFGPFALMDTFDPNYSPNHDDGSLRYSYSNTPTAVWWSLTRLGESLAELLGANAEMLADEHFLQEGPAESQTDEIIARAEGRIERAGEEYQKVVGDKYNELMRQRLALVQEEESDYEELFRPMLRMLERCELDFNKFFRKLGDFPLFPEPALQKEKLAKKAEIFFPQDRGAYPDLSLDEAINDELLPWLEIFRARLQKEGSVDDGARQERSRKVNPKFVLNNWILNEVIENVSQWSTPVYLDKVLKMCLDPFNETWGLSKQEEERLTGDVPRRERGSQCSCSS